MTSDWMQPDVGRRRGKMAAQALQDAAVDRFLDVTSVRKCWFQAGCGDSSNQEGNLSRQDAKHAKELVLIPLASLREKFDQHRDSL